MMERVDKAIEDAFNIGIENDLSSEFLHRHFKFMLKQIAVAAIEAVQTEQNNYVFEAKRHLQN
jgi:hypothetical protein